MNSEQGYVLITQTNSPHMQQLLSIKHQLCREIPISEAVRCQIEVQKTLQEQLEVKNAKKHNNSALASLHLYNE